MSSKILTIAAIAMFAVILGMGSLTPVAFADNVDNGHAKNCDKDDGEDHDNRSDKSKGWNCAAKTPRGSSS